RDPEVEGPAVPPLPVPAATLAPAAVETTVVETTVVEVAVAHVQQQGEQQQGEQTVNDAATDVPSTRRRVRDLTLPLVLDGEPPADDGPDTYDRVALARAADVTEAELDELESFGLIKPFYDDGIRAFYDRDPLACVRAAAALA